MESTISTKDLKSKLERQPLTQLQTYTRIALDVADVSRVHAMLCHWPKLISETSIAYWRAPWLPRLPSFRATHIRVAADPSQARA